jgi:hypothetical protein
MSDVHELIESIRVTLSSSLNHNREDLAELHDQLDDYIRTVNKRLRECDSLLANGHRSEAIQLAEQEPNLLELVGILDLPELTEWNDFVAEHGLRVTPDLQIDIATDLNHAYSDDTPLERYLNRLRVYSIGRAPLRTRIDILRKISKIDIESPHWQDDLKSYEKLRIRQMQDEYRTAKEKHNYTKLQELQQEIKEKPWSVKPRKQLLERIEASLAVAQQGESLVRLQGLYQSLQAAMQDDDITAAEQLAEQWNDTMETCNHDSDGFQQLYEDAAPVMKWIEQHYDAQQHEEEQKQKVDKLKRMLRSPRATVEVLETRHEDLVDDGVTIPAGIEEKYQAKIAELSKQASLQRNLKFGGVVLVAVLLLGFAIYSFF